ncbi:TetR/AcrR family transcriptional regulator [Primorskyibacter aestuariivivens]|uniref:TetR/AcrR family transcriptional regulator n=1 Tax=Primorskyibacter aestuariivivens TaxID=1888912 RepID=UPI002301052E|nr:TetR/AcrR family transcriptional regulator [Primorskyibacter aestuariivivens]MDA7427069.1 TetR/AcrR family transcriptional regulator [Primorskyibacter aestuariivivens]
MAKRDTPLLHRDDPDKAPLVGHIKVTREDWLNVARDALVTGGVGEVKVLSLAARLDVSRSSFYGYFKSRKHLLAALLEDWERRNTRTLVTHCEMPAGNITEGLCNFFRCFVDPRLFDRGLDFAVREWSRRDAKVRAGIDAADSARLDAVTRMFIHHRYDPVEADARARILYFMQLGYHALEVREPMDLRMSRLEPYILGFSGRPADPIAIAAFRDFALAQE